MTVLGVLGALVVLFIAAVVAVRDEPLLADAPPDRRDLGLPAAGPVRAEHLEQVRFGMVVRGYRMAEVDAVLDRVAAELRERDERLAALEDEVGRGRDAAEAGEPRRGPACDRSASGGASPA